jgi:hypothetical protein
MLREDSNRNTLMSQAAADESKQRNRFYILSLCPRETPPSGCSARDSVARAPVCAEF